MHGLETLFNSSIFGMNRSYNTAFVKSARAMCTLLFHILTPKGLRHPKRPFLILGRLPYAPKLVDVSKTSWKE